MRLYAAIALSCVLSILGACALAQTAGRDSSSRFEAQGAIASGNAGPDSTSVITINFSDARPSMRVEAFGRGGAYYLSDIDLSAAFGISIKWDPLFRLLTLAGRKGEAVAVVGGTAVAMGDRAVNLSHPFLEEPGRLLIPIDFLTMELHYLTGFRASWREGSAELLASANEPSVLGVTLGGRPGLARVTVSTSRPLAYKVLEEEGQLRLAVKGAVPDSAFDVKGTAMSPVRGHALDWIGDELILKLDLSADARSFQTFREAYPQAIVLLVSSATYREGFDLEPLAGAYRHWGRVRTIVLDPAHGGDDWGAVGRGGIKEKDVVLQICKKAASILEDRLGVDVYLTRDSDYRVPPAGRAETANGRGADLFVSVHCDSWPGDGRSGYGACVLPPPVTEGGYWSPETRRSVGLGASDVETGLIVRPWRRAQGRYGRQSRSLARAVLREMNVIHDGPGLGMKEMALVSLIGIDAPAVGVRCGFLDNSRDLELLGDSEGRSRLAAAIAKGVEAYLNE